MKLSKDTKIIIVVFIFLFGWLFDHFSHRVFFLESQVQKLYPLTDQVFNLERDIKPLQNNPSRIKEMEPKVDLIEDMYTKLTFFRRKMRTFEYMINIFMDRKKVDLKVFTTSSDKNLVDDAEIVSCPQNVDRNFGASQALATGKDSHDCAYRSLVLFKDLLTRIPKTAKIMAANFSIRQEANMRESQRMSRQSLDVFAVKKPWNEGNKDGELAQEGEITWNSAQKGVLDWSAPGCSMIGQDYDNTILASSDPTILRSNNDWILMNFNIDGLSILQDWISGKRTDYYGFLLMSEERSETMVSFFASDTVSYAPTLEIIYYDEGL